jgi:hypothetical protein
MGLSLTQNVLQSLRHPRSRLPLHQHWHSVLEGQSPKPPDLGDDCFPQPPSKRCDHFAVGAGWSRWQSESHSYPTPDKPMPLT